MEVDPERPVLVDKYMDRADELDVDALCDKDGNVTICGIMQHIEQAGVHSGMPLAATGFGFHVLVFAILQEIVPVKRWQCRLVSCASAESRSSPFAMCHQCLHTWQALS